MLTMTYTTSWTPRLNPWMTQDFHEPLQSSDWHLQIKSEDKSRLEGNQEKVTASAPKSSETFHAVCYDTGKIYI